MKNEVLIHYLQNEFGNKFLVKAEFSTNDKDNRVIIVQEQPGRKVVFFGDIDPMFNYFKVVVYGLTIRESYEASTIIGSLIGHNYVFDYKNQKWQIIFKQYSNPQAIQYIDIRRVGYTATLQCIISRIA